MTPETRAGIQGRAEAAMPGPWAWRGYVDGPIELRTVGHGGQRIVTSMRSEPCVVQLLDETIALTYEACDSCQKEAEKRYDPFVDHHCPKEYNLNTIWLHDQGASTIRPANYWAEREVPYRGDVARVAHPDAEFIAHARDDVPVLLDALETAEAQRNALADQLRVLVTCWPGVVNAAPKDWKQWRAKIADAESGYSAVVAAAQTLLDEIYAT